MKKLTSSLIRACIAVLAVVAASSCDTIVPITVDMPALQTVAPGSKIACSGTGKSIWKKDTIRAASAAQQLIAKYGCFIPVESTDSCDYSLEFSWMEENNRPVFFTSLYSYGTPGRDVFTSYDMRAYYRHERSLEPLELLVMSAATEEKFIRLFAKSNVAAWAHEGLNILYPHLSTQEVFTVAPFAGSEVKAAAESCIAGNWDKAEQQALAAVVADPNSGEAYNLLGIIALQKRQFDRAEGYFKQADRVDPSEKYIEALKLAMDIRALAERAYADLRRLGLSQIPF